MLTEVQKQTIIDLRTQGFSYAEIAGILQLSPNTVKSLCRRSHIKPEKLKEKSSGLCQNCGKQLYHRSGTKPKTFCCSQCRYEWWNRHRRKKPYRLICQHCGREFVSFGNKKRKFCGRECYRLSRYGEGLP